MKILFSILCITLSYTSFSQESHSVNTSRFRIGIIAQPNIAYRRLLKIENDDFLDLIITDRNKREIPKLGYNFGLNTEFKIANHFKLETGVNYSNKGYRTKKIVAFTSEPGLSHFQIGYVHHYIEVPLVLNYIVGKNKLKLISSFGVSMNVLVSSKIKSILYYENSSNKTTYSNMENEFETYKKFNLTPSVSIGVEYQINAKTSIKVQPTFNYSILNIIDAPISAHLWSTGIQFGYYIGF